MNGDDVLGNMMVGRMQYPPAMRRHALAQGRPDPFGRSACNIAAGWRRFLVSGFGPGAECLVGTGAQADGIRRRHSQRQHVTRA